MPSEARLKKYRNIKDGPKNLNFGASKPGVRGGSRPPPGSAPGPLLGEILDQPLYL